MLSRRRLLSAVLAAGFWAGELRFVHAADSTEIAIVVHPEIDVKSLTANELSAVYTASTRKWNDGKTVVPFNATPKSDLRVQFDQVVLDMTPEQSSRFWIDAQIRGTGHPPRQVADPRLAVRLVARLPGAIAYVPANLIDATVRVVARIKNGKVVPQ